MKKSTLAISTLLAAFAFNGIVCADNTVNNRHNLTKHSQHKKAIYHSKTNHNKSMNSKSMHNATQKTLS